MSGPIFKLALPAERIFVGNFALAEPLFDEKRFQKSVSGPLEQVRNAVHDGLFTAYPDEPNWAVAHRTLMPAFGPLPIRSMFGGECPRISITLDCADAERAPRDAGHCLSDGPEVGKIRSGTSHRCQ